jgi:hypothetical protein
MAEQLGDQLAASWIETRMTSMLQSLFAPGRQHQHQHQQPSPAHNQGERVQER